LIKDPIAAIAPVLIFPLVYLWKLSIVPPRLHYKGTKRQRRLSARITNLEKQWVQDSGMSIVLPGYPMYVGGLKDAKKQDLPPRSALFVRVQAGTKSLHDCQVKFNHCQYHAEYVVSPQFDLRPGEHKDVPVLHLLVGNDGSSLPPLLPYLWAPEWELEHDGGTPVFAGVYRITTYATDCRPVAVQAKLQCTVREGGKPNWTLNACA
jgi:hypothetical protein